MMRSLLFSVTLVSASALAQAPDVVELETTITGSKQQPKVIYVLPWQQPEAPQALTQALERYLHQRPIAPLDREQFLRELHYRRQLQAGSQSDR